MVKAPHNVLATQTSHIDLIVILTNQRLKKDSHRFDDWCSAVVLL